MAKITLIVYLFLAFVTIQQSQCMREKLNALSDMLYNKMLADITPCQGTQKELNQLNFGELIGPNIKCDEECSKDGLKFVQGDFKYSGSNVLCCCGKKLDNSE